MNDIYFKRIVDDELGFRLDNFGAVLIEGPKWCGKTSTAIQFSKSILYLQDENKIENHLTIASIDISSLLVGDNPRLIDEWQIIPNIWDAVRFEIDKRKTTNLFILTGSNTIDFTKIKHSGIGRISRLVMYPMSLYESNESNGKISLQYLFENPNCDVNNIKADLSFNQLIFATCRGGWPSSLFRKTDKGKLFVAFDYFNSLIQSEMISFDHVKRNSLKTKMLITSLARNICTFAKKTTILEDVNTNHKYFSIKSFNDYLNTLKQLFVIDEINAFNVNLRSATAIEVNQNTFFLIAQLQSLHLELIPNIF